MRPVVRTVLALVVSLTVLQATSAVVGAFEYKGRGLYAKFGPSSATSVRGLVTVHRANSDVPPLDLNLLGLRATEQVIISFRSIECAGTPTQSNRVARLRMMADENGHLFARTSSSQRDWASVRSVWINQDGESVCRKAVQFEVIAGGPGAGPHRAGLGHSHPNDPVLDWNAITLLERLPNDRARLTIVIGGLEGEHDLRLRIVDEQCGAGPGSTLVSQELHNVDIAGFRSVVVDSAAEEIFEDAANGSVRIRGINGSDVAGCGPLSIIAILIS